MKIRPTSTKKERVRQLPGCEISVVVWRSVLISFVFVCASFTATVTAEPGVPEAQTLDQRGVVTGIVRTSTGLPLPEIRIAIGPLDLPLPNGALHAEQLTAFTDSTGRYRLEKLSPGRYSIRVGMNGPGYYLPGMPTAIQVSAGGPTEVPDMVVPGGPVTGRVVASGIAHHVETLVLCCDYFQQLQYGEKGLKQGSPFLPTISDDGSFVFPFVPAGNYALSLKDRRVIPVSWALAVGQNGISGLQLNVLEGVEVQGTVLDQNDKPVYADIRLVARPAKSIFNTIDAPAATGDRPSYLEGGTSLGNRPALRGILVPRAYPSLDEIQNLILAVARSQEHSALPDRLATPESDGRFAIQNVYPGTYQLEVNARGVVLAGREVQVGTAGLTNISIQVPAIQVTGRVIVPGNGPLPKLSYIQLVRSGADTDVFYGFPNSQGQFSLVLTPGSYRVTTENLGRTVQSVSDGIRDITHAEFVIDGGRSPQLIVTLAP